MLIELDEPKLTFIRLKNGDDLISMAQYLEKDDFDEPRVILYNPAKVIYNINPSGFLNITFMQWIFDEVCPEQHFTIDKDEIMTTSVPSTELSDYYTKSVNEMSTTKEETPVVVEPEGYIHDFYDDEMITKELRETDRIAEIKLHKDLSEVFYRNNKKSMN